MIDTVKILWTGGWDSSFRVLYVAMVEGRHVEPHYIIDTGRRSTTNELRAISRMRDALQVMGHDAAQRIGPLRLMPQNEVPKDAAIADAWTRLRRQCDIARQYALLARYAQHQGLEGLELCVEKDCGIYSLLTAHMEPTLSGAARLTPGAIDGGALFERFEFPVLELLKRDMYEIAKQHAFLDILSKSWFCHRPLGREKPCGLCAPCQAVVHHGLSYRLPPAGMIRYHLWQLAKKCARLVGAR